jgi:hypothetical protein
MSFVNVFVYIFDRLDVATSLDIDMTIVTHQEFRIVWNHPSVV